MRILCTAVCLALCSSGALAAEYGIGVSAKSDDAWIYVPIDINNKFRIEPSVRYASSEFSQALTGTVDDEDSRKQETDSMEIGIGVFGLAKVAESAQIYYGVRAAYVDAESTVTDTYTYFPGYTITTDSESSQDGYRIGPAIGFEYLFGEHFSIGGEANYTFLDIEGESTATIRGSTSTSRINTEQKSNGTGTQLIIRYRF